ncbi:MAG: S8 family serine peptidase [Bdellovibrionales bacterium]
MKRHFGPIALLLFLPGCHSRPPMDLAVENIKASSGVTLEKAAALEKYDKLDGTLAALALRAKSEDLESVIEGEATASFNAEEDADNSENLVVSAPEQRADGKIAVKIYAAEGHTSQDVIDALLPLGYESMAKNADASEGYLPAASLEAASHSAAVQGITAIATLKFAGQVLSEGDAAMRSDDVRRVYRATGKGSTVGVISDSFNCLGGADEDIATGDLPSDVNVVGEATCTSARADEGRAMAQIVHDIAPDAKITFHTGVGLGHIAFVQAIDKLISAGARVIADDVAVLAEPWFQQTILTEAISERTKSHNITYVASAGNLGPEFSYAAPFVASTEQLNPAIGVFHKFGREAGDQSPLVAVRINAGARATFALQWDQPWRIGTSTQGPMSNLDLVIYTFAGRFVAGAFTNNIVNGRAFEGITLTNNGSTHIDLLVGVALNSGPAPDRLQLVVGNGAFFLASNVKIDGPGILHHANSPHVLAVGATTVIGPQSSPPLIAFYSSAGGSPIKYDVNGQTITPLILPKPDIVGPDGVNTTFFGSDLDGDGVPNFRGTSASAPHIAGVVALLKERMPDARFEFLQKSLTSTAVDMDDPVTPEFDAGFDYGTGHGFVDAMQAMVEILKPNIPPQVRLSPSQSAPLNTAVRIDATITDDLRPGTSKYALTHKWEITRGISVASASEVQVLSSDATGITLKFLKQGAYKIRLTTSDSEKTGTMISAVIAGF